MAETFNIDFVPNPTQKAFIESRPVKDGTIEADIFNSRLGEGKSAALVWAIYWHTKQNSGANWAMVRDTYINLERSTMREFFEWFPPGICGTHHKGKKEWSWNPDVMGFSGTIMFLGMDDDQTATKIQSTPLAGFVCDEVSPVAGSGGISYTVFRTLMQRLRQRGMQYYVGKLAQNNPDESHWTFAEFVDPGKKARNNFQTHMPENLENLPEDYYEQMTDLYAGEQDKINRFVLGKFGFQQEGKAVTPQWSDGVHLGRRIQPVRNVKLHLGWDFGGNCTCAITQITPMGTFNVLDAWAGEDGTGVTQLVEDCVKPRLVERYKGFNWDHTGDPTGASREASDSSRSAVKSIKDQLGGTWRPGPVQVSERLIPLRAVLRRMGDNGRGVVQVDKDNARCIWHALRGGWHFQTGRGGIVSAMPKKDHHSHPGDVMGYLAARFYPQGRPKGTKADNPVRPATAKYWANRMGGLSRMPKHGDKPESLPVRRS